MSKNNSVTGNSNIRNNNTYVGGTFSIIENVLMTPYASIPLSNISRTFVLNTTKKPSVKLLIAGILLLIIGIFVSIFICIIGVCILLYCILTAKKCYTLVIESNSGSRETFTSGNLQILQNAQGYIEKGIMSLNRGETNYVITYNTNNGEISYESKDIMVHGSVNNSSITSGR